MVCATIVFFSGATRCAQFDAESKFLAALLNLSSGGGGGNAAGSDWWNSSWNSRIQITFDNSAAGENLQNFPVLIKLNSSRVDYTATQDQGQDIRFIDADNVTELAYEIETWNESGDSFVWVRVPRIDSGSSTDSIYFYFNNSAAADAQSASTVWSNDYTGVWHLDEDPSGAAPQMSDSSASGNNGTSEGTMTTGDQVTGQISGSLELEGTDDAVDFGTGCLVSGTWTMSLWVYPSSPGNFNRALMQGGTACGSRQIMAFWHTDHLEFRTATTSTAGAAQLASGTLADSTWNYVVWTFDGTTHTSYVNGTSSSGTINSVNVGITGNLYLGRRNSGNYWTGRLDEPRFATAVRSADWIAAQYNSMTDGFATYAAAEQQ